jgi:hypothetical protein
MTWFHARLQTFPSPVRVKTLSLFDPALTTVGPLLLAAGSPEIPPSCGRRTQGAVHALV